MAAEVGGGGGGGKHKKSHGKKKPNPRIDMTPMVDLGFLLLTFFVLTTTMSTPTALPVIVPAEDDKVKPEEREKVSEEKVLTLLITGKDRVYWYTGTSKKEGAEGGGVELNRTGYYNESGVRKVILERKNFVKANKAKFGFTEDDPLIVLIKMSDDATYANMVDILDEMNISEQKKYMLLEATKDEIEFIKAYEESRNEPLSVEKSLQAFGA